MIRSLGRLSSFSKNLAFSGAVTGVSTLFNFLLQIVVLRVFGLSTYGGFTFWRNNVYLAATVGRLGLHSLSFKEIPAFLENRDRSAMMAYLRFAAVLTLAASAVGIAIFEVLGISSKDAAGRGSTFALAAMLLSISLVAVSIFRVVGSLRLSLVLDRISIIALFLVMVGGWGLLFERPNGDLVYPLFCIAIAVTAAANLMGVTLGIRKIDWRPADRAGHTRDAVAAWISSGWHLFLLSIGSIAAQRSTILVLGLLLAAAPLGRYAFMAMMAGLIALPLQAFNQVVAPTLSTHRIRGEFPEIVGIIRKVAKLSFFMGAVFVLAVFLAHPLIEWVVDQPGLTIPGVLALLLLSALINAGFGPVAVGLSMLGEERFASRVIVIAVAIKVGVLLLAVPSLGLYGAAITEVIFTLSWNLTMALKLRATLRAMPSHA